MTSDNLLEGDPDDLNLPLEQISEEIHYDYMYQSIKRSTIPANNGNTFAMGQIWHMEDVDMWFNDARFRGEAHDPIPCIEELVALDAAGIAYTRHGVIGWELIPYADYQPYMTAFIALDAKGVAYLRTLCSAEAHRYGVWHDGEILELQHFNEAEVDPNALSYPLISNDLEKSAERTAF